MAKAASYLKILKDAANGKVDEDYLNDLSPDLARFGISIRDLFDNISVQICNTLSSDVEPDATGEEDLNGTD